MEDPSVAEPDPPAPAPAASDRAAAPGGQRLPHTFGLKDVFTSINILCGLLAIIFCVEGNVRHAAYAFLLGWLLGDSLDGPVARATNSSNRFGAEFDVIGDHLTQCIVPGAMIYAAYRPLSPYLAAALAGLLVLTGSVRHARAEVAPTNVPFAYVGMPRTVSSLIVIAFLNSAAVSKLPGSLYFGIPLIAFVSIAHLLPIPFRSHKGRQLKRWVIPFLFAFFGMTAGALLFFRTYTFDVVLFWLLLYSSTSWLELDREERREFFTRARAWARAVRAAR